MHAGLLLQYALVALIVAWGAWVVVHKLLPRQVRTLRGRIAMACLREHHPAWLRRWGRVIAPPAAADAGCGSCNSCDTPKQH